MRVFSVMVLVILALVAPVMAQQLVNELPAVQTATNEAMRQIRATASTEQKRVVNFTPMGGGDGGYTGLPPVALIINRLQFEEGQQLQTSLLTLHGNYFSAVRVVRFMMHADSSTMRTGSFFTTLVPGETTPIQNYTFDGSEPSGVYIYYVVLFDPWDNPFAQVGGTFVFRGITERNDGSGFARIENAEVQGGSLNLRGRFFRTDLPSIGMGQWVTIGRRAFPIVKATETEATVDLGGANLASGIYDLTLVVRRNGNIAYDSVTAPGILRVYRPRPPQPIIGQ